MEIRESLQMTIYVSIGQNIKICYAKLTVLHEHCDAAHIDEPSKHMYLL